MSQYRFKRGDYISAERADVVLYGTAMEDKGRSGFAAFTLLLKGTNQTIELNLNYWKTTLIFSADVARGEA